MDTTEDPASIYWPSYADITAEPRVTLHKTGFAFVDLGAVTMHIRTAAQARALVKVFAEAAMLLDPPHPLECGKCGASPATAVIVTTSDGVDRCYNRVKCAERVAARDAEAAKAGAR